MRVTMLLASILCFATHAVASTWLIDPAKSTIRFKVNHVVTAVEGEFRRFHGTVKLNEKDISKSRIMVGVEMGSVNTDTLGLTDDLRSDRYLDVARYPTMTFVAKSIAQRRPDNLQVAGDLTLHGVTRKVVLDVTWPEAVSREHDGKMRRGATATTRINRKDFGFKWTELLATGLDDDIDISIDIVLVNGH